MSGTRCSRRFAGIAVALGAAALFTSLPCAGQPPPQPAEWLDPNTTAPEGTLYRTFPSALAGREVSYLIYLPPGYETGTGRYPVVYWLHGLNGTQRSGQAFTAGLNRAIRFQHAPPMIAVLVNGLRDKFYCDTPDGRWPLESVIIRELIPHVDATYRTIAERRARAVEGYSLGGFGAAHLGFKYPEVFGMVGIMAGALLESDDPSRRADLFEGVFRNDLAYYKANHPRNLVSANAGAVRGRTAVRIAVGDQDRLQAGNQSFRELLQQLKIEHEYEVVPGVGHEQPRFYELLGRRAFAWYARALTPERVTGPRMSQKVERRSLLIPRGDVEISTFESREDFERLERLYEQGLRTKPAPGTRSTRYFRSRMDGSVQVYALHLPRGYDGGRRYPLMVQLHGLQFNKVIGGRRPAFSGYGGKGNEWIDPELPVIVAQVNGRQSTFYIGMGEQDVLEVIEDVRRIASVDESRISIMGHSMGGAGSFTAGLHHPDRFAAITPIDAAMGRRVPSPPASVPEWMAPQVATHDFASLFPNARNTPVYMKNAGAGIQGDSTLVTEGIVAHGGFSTSESFPGAPHGFADIMPYSTFIPAAVSRPAPKNPAEVRLATNTLRYNRAYWVTIDRLTRHGAPSQLIARFAAGEKGGPAKVEVRASGIEALTLRLADAAGGRNLSGMVTVNDREAVSGPLPGVLHLSRRSGEWRAAGEADVAGKRHGMQGPAGDAFLSKFLAVYGDGDKEMAHAEIDALRNPVGPLINDGDFPLKTAGSVTAEDVKTCNLILFGSPATNAVLRRIASRLPAALLKPPGEGTGTVFVHPNPENPDRYVVVWSAPILSIDHNGLRAGFIMPVHLLPDWAVIRNGRIVSGGHFDEDWRLAAEPSP